MADVKAKNVIISGLFEAFEEKASLNYVFYLICHALIS